MNLSSPTPFSGQPLSFPSSTSTSYLWPLTPFPTSFLALARQRVNCGLPGSSRPGLTREAPVAAELAHCCFEVSELRPALGAREFLFLAFCPPPTGCTRIPSFKSSMTPLSHPRCPPTLLGSAAPRQPACAQAGPCRLGTTRGWAGPPRGRWPSPGSRATRGSRASAAVRLASSPVATLEQASSRPAFCAQDKWRAARALARSAEEPSPASPPPPGPPVRLQRVLY